MVVGGGIPSEFSSTYLFNGHWVLPSPPQFVNGLGISSEVFFQTYKDDRESLTDGVDVKNPLR